jgi:hypothetical protein
VPAEEDQRAERAREDEPPERHLLGEEVDRVEHGRQERRDGRVREVQPDH